jgi:Tfp pilus assembly protein PilF
MRLWLVLLLGFTTPAWCAPRVPGDEREVLERLPVRPSDPVAAELRKLRAGVAAAPSDPLPAAQLARRYFDLAMAQGDPRYVGYADAALRPWYSVANQHPGVLTARGLLRQYRHDFDGALEDLAAAAQRDPQDPEPHAWRAAIFMVRADYPAARRECEALRERSGELHAAGCFAYVDATTGRARAAYEALGAALARNETAPAGLRLWVLTRLAEIAWRLDDARAAERHFRAALGLDLTDNFLLAAYADFLLEQGRAAEVVALLKDWTRSDTLLLRLALAERALRLPAAEPHARMLGERFADSAQRGERLHLQEEARYLLELKGDARAALAAAAENWKAQREPRDAAVLLKAGLAAKDPRSATPALEWLDATGFESSALRRIAESLKASSR